SPVSPGESDLQPVRPRSQDDLEYLAREEGIKGIVVTERNEDVPGATCDLHEDSASNPQMSEEGVLRDSRISDDKGGFFFDAKALGSAHDRFVIKVTHPAFAMQRLEVDLSKRRPRVLAFVMRPGIEISGTVRSTVGDALRGTVISVYDLDTATPDGGGSLEAV